MTFMHQMKIKYRNMLNEFSRTKPHNNLVHTAFPLDLVIQRTLNYMNHKKCFTDVFTRLFINGIPLWGREKSNFFHFERHNVNQRDALQLKNTFQIKKAYLRLLLVYFLRNSFRNNKRLQNWILL